MSGIESHPSGAEKDYFADRPELKRFIHDRNIRATDFELIAGLMQVPSNVVIAEMHNMFNVNRDRSGEELKLQMTRLAETDDRKKLNESFLALFDTYGWATCYHLVRILEGEYN
jgi:hypothetical protein